ncbi:hybrid sensor histidine kinase/response regulator [Magnetospirillum sulfuroxidans]|uniref:histidine kinase n=1 Tax=Magnetospirillum sulfuroxidans TaxID=611300 RepID=A0ABS5ICJ0_9PROT|nr:hybrid sensor histidine kinase/response regulator [Magnetospirillum sulfuroxidans]MBR9972137.1 PAS domain S-box protein [Magnetospirillum sulfuroxidans]
MVGPFRRRAVVSRLRSRISELELAQKEANSARDALMATTKALRESEERYALAMRGPNEGLWDWNPISKELYLSARLLAILGFSGETVRTNSHEWLKMVHPDDRGYYQETLIRYLKGGSDYFESEYRVRDRNGEYRWILSRGLAVRDEQGIATRMVGSLGDITDRKRREAILRASESRFRSLVEVAASIIVVVGGDGRVQEFNREAERMFGLTAAVAIGKLWGEILGRDHVGADGGVFDQWLAHVREGQEIRDHETVLGQYIISWNLAPLDSDDDGVVIVGQDITDRRRAETALRQANDLLEYRVAARTEEAESARRQAEAANHYKSEFLANMSHELRTPLNAIIGFSDAMRLEVMGKMENPLYKEYVQAIWESGTHLLSIINEVLDLSKVEAGHFDLTPEWLPLVPLAEQVIRLMAEKAMRHRLDLRLHTECDPGQALVDPLRFKQVLFNLLANSVKFTPAGGHVILALGRDGLGVWIKVTDSGIGMHAKDIDRVLEPYVQVECDLSRQFAGTGLGLPLAKRFIELHGGTLTLDSQPGQGTTVTIRLSSPPLDC